MDGSILEPDPADICFGVPADGSVFELEPAPPSPGSAPVRLTSCLEELLKFTLSASLVEDSDVPLRLCRGYCERILRDDPFSSQISLMEVGGVPPYPLYKHLARALEGCLSSGTFFRERKSVKGVREDDSFELKQREWDRLIEEKGIELVNMLEDVGFELHVQEPFFSQLRDGLKTVEGRCATGDYDRISTGSLLLFNKCLLLKVQHVRHYSSFSEMLQVELADALPGCLTIEEGVQIYRNFYSEEKEKSNGVLAINVLKEASQPYISLGNLLAGLGCEGIGSLLGMMHTTGTISDPLPPPRSLLLSSFTELHRSNVKGSLTGAARALAKHVQRSSDGWWGSFSRGDPEKNKRALEIIDYLLNECCWMNMYNIHSHGCVFEIRVHEGYGARWSHDGTKVSSEHPSFGDPISQHSAKLHRPISLQPVDFSSDFGGSSNIELQEEIVLPIGATESDNVETLCAIPEYDAGYVCYSRVKEDSSSTEIVNVDIF